MNKDRHTFAIFYLGSSFFCDTKLNTCVSLRDTDLIHRLATILKVKTGQDCILFDSQYSLEVRVETVSKKEITVCILTCKKNKPLEPRIHWLLPLLMREAFEECAYILTALGATTLHPIVTAKSHRTQLSLKELERLERITIAASEQSKQFVLPSIAPLSTLESFLINNSTYKNLDKIFFDPTGLPAQEVINKLRARELVESKEPSDIVCLIGPEADLTTQEKKTCFDWGFSPCKLSNSILRSEHAVTVGMGLLRSLL